MDQFRDSSASFYDEEDNASHAIEAIEKLSSDHEIKFEEGFPDLIGLLLHLKSAVRHQI